MGVSVVEFYDALTYSAICNEVVVRVLKLRGFAKFQRGERFTDAALVKVVRDAERGLIDAELGGGLIKQRLARSGKGKRGGIG